MKFKVITSPYASSLEGMLNTHPNYDLVGFTYSNNNYTAVLQLTINIQTDTLT